GKCLDDLQPFLDKLSAMDLDSAQGLSYADFTDEAALLETEYRSVHWSHIAAPCSHIERWSDQAVGAFTNIASNWTTCEQTDPNCKVDFRSFYRRSLYGASVAVAKVHDAADAAQRAIDQS